MKTSWSTTWTNFASAITEAQADIKTAWDALVTIFGPTMETLQSSFVALGSDLGALGPEFAELEDAMRDLWDAIAPILQQMALGIGAAFGVVSIIALNVFGGTIERLGPTVKVAIELITATIDTVATVIRETTTIVQAIIDGDWATAWASAQTISQSFFDLFENAVSGFQTLAETTFSTTVATMSNILKGLGFTEAAAAVQNASDKIKEFVEWLGKVAGGDIALNIQMSDLVNNLKNELEIELAKVDWGEFISQVDEFVANFLSGLAAGLIDADFSVVINPIKEKFKAILDIFQKPQEAAPGGIGLPAHLLNNQQRVDENFWAKIVPPLDWATFIPATLAWATFVPDILYWHNFITETLAWKTFIPDVLAWKTFIPDNLSWRTFVPNDIQWSDFVPDLNWEDFWNFFTGGETTSTSTTTGNSADAENRSGSRLRAFEPALAFAGAAPGGDIINIHISAQIANDIDINQLTYRIADVLRRRRP
jgi:hypothetical protein